MEWGFEVTKELEWPPLEQPLVDTLRWTATFESYDREHLCCRFKFQLLDGDRAITTASVPVVLSRAPRADGDDPQLVDEVRTRFDRFAVRLAISRCERCDWLIRLAYGAASDHHEALYRGLLYSKPDGSFVNVRKVLWPVVKPREVVYAKLDLLDAEMEWMFARLSGLLLGMAPALLIAYFVDPPSEYETPVITGLILGFGFVMRRLILWLRGRVIRREATTMSDDQALLIVLEDLKVAMAVPVPEERREAHDKMRQFSLKALRGHLLGSFPEVPTAEDFQLDRIGAQLER